ncbi:hypothetical protein [Amycolatopsis suaedae]|uniref:HK97 gp10 family phage protein n=1 Tax=Amycolatopsis suaedae TaxID=2510978 RepID=A0A4Q7IZH8_9PSEU|nr:hypothetical protein [Amycolatopsis suaedae]RZQ59838.1 hypothetical protein EWH70_32510 [Amycolatopsis suaedae]
MPAHVEIRGTESFRRTARKLKEAGDGRLTREMAKKMRTAAKPAVDDAQRSVRGLATAANGRGGGGQARREHAMSRVRKKTNRTRQRAFEGRGLRATVGRALQTQTRARGQTASVQIKVNKSLLPANQRKLPAHMNTGRWRHPVFGRPVWVTQTTNPPKWFDRPMSRHGRRIRNRAVEAVDEIKRKIK